MDLSDLVLRLAAALLAGMLIGLEREWREKAAGLRTLTLVSVGSALFMIATLQALPSEGVRMMAGIATGIGFLGAGTIMRAEGEVFGLTTAASVWLSAALGVSAALGQFTLTMIGAVLGIIILTALSYVPLEHVQQVAYTYVLTWGGPTGIDRVTAPGCFAEEGLSARLLGVSATEGGRVAVTWHAFGDNKSHLAAIERLGNEPQLISFEMYE